ncbi:MAG: bifunctional UDP-N-acetylglucosamine diphosphorylase/glucosamine-1-phosphate N-acetyltransferase GlmU [Myxococcota bacterium]
MSATVAIVLAAGKGTRMRSELPKVLHQIAGWSLAEWSVNAALEAGADRCVVVVGHGRERVEGVLRERFGDRVTFALQEEQLGTGHAVRCAVEQRLQRFDGRVLVTYGDCPLIQGPTLAQLLASDAPCALLTTHRDDPTGYGRMVRKDGQIAAIVEHKDATPEQRAICEVNPGLYAFDGGFLQRALEQLDMNNAQGELYLTDLVAMAERVDDFVVPIDEVRGINDRRELAECGELMRRRIAERWASAGAAIEDLGAVYTGADCEVQPDARIDAGVHLRGKTRIESGAHVDVGCVLRDVHVSAGAYLHPYTVAAESQIGAKAQVGPFTHLRPKTNLGEGSKVGNFCETKKTNLGKGSKVNHLAYVGDGEIGEGVNIGAGVIFCNYDGVKKHTTTLEDGVFIGSDSQLVAPITVGQGAYVASGSTITRDVPADALALSRTKQENKEGYASRLRRRMEAAKKKA